MRLGTRDRELLPVFISTGPVVEKRADMAEQTTGALAPGARCFCCFEEGVGAAGAAGAAGTLAVTPCGCQCLTLFACPRCMWRLVAPPGSPGEVPRPVQMQCKVCLGRFSDAVVLMACRHAVEGALALVVGAAPGAEQEAVSEARHNALLGVMETLLKIEDANADAALALARVVVAEQEAFCGAQHMTAVHFRVMLGYVLSRFERDQEAVAIFNACAWAQRAMVQNWDAAEPLASDRKWMHRTLRSRLNAVMSRIAAMETAEARTPEGPQAGLQSAEAQEPLRQYIEIELLEVYKRLEKLFGPLHRDSLAAIFMFTKVIAERVLRKLGGAPARTRAQKAQLQVARDAVDVGLLNAEAAMAFLPAAGGALVSVAREHMLEHRAALAGRAPEGPLAAGAEAAGAEAA